MTFVDNTLGINLQMGEERDEGLLKFYDSIIYGQDTDQPNPCPEANACYCEDSAGFLLFTHNINSKPLMPDNER